MASDPYLRRKLRALAILGYLKPVGAHSEDDSSSTGAAAPTPLTMDRTDITFDMTEV